jgi:hypothetical protein
MDSAAMVVLLYYCVGILVLFIIWYSGLAMWKSDRAHIGVAYWYRRVEISDMPGRDRLWGKDGSPGLPDRRTVWFMATLCALCIGYATVTVVLVVPLSAEMQCLLFGVVAVATPLAAVMATYGKLLRRVIPLAWGAQIALASSVMLAAVKRPWGLDPSTIIDRIVAYWPVAIFIGMAPALLFARTLLAMYGGGRWPGEWLGFCIIAAFWGSAWVCVGIGAVPWLL